jgi:hypothetical protein
VLRDRNAIAFGQRWSYRDGMEDQLGALGLILNTITLWNTVYLDHALQQLRATGYPVLDADVARLSPYMRRHINFHGHYSFAPAGRYATPTHPTTTDRARSRRRRRRKQPISCEPRDGSR